MSNISIWFQSLDIWRMGKPKKHEMCIDGNAWLLEFCGWQVSSSVKSPTGSLQQVPSSSSYSRSPSRSPSHCWTQLFALDLFLVLLLLLLSPIGVKKRLLGIPFQRPAPAFLVRLVRAVVRGLLFPCCRCLLGGCPPGFVFE